MRLARPLMQSGSVWIAAISQRPPRCDDVEFVGERVARAARVVRLTIASTAPPSAAQPRRCTESSARRTLGTRPARPLVESAASSPGEAAR